MKSDRNCPCPRRQGSALVLSLLFIVMFSALAVAMVGMSGANVQIANNQREAAQALASAHSGLEILRHYLRKINIPMASPSGRMDLIAQELQARLTGLPNMSVSYDPTLKTITVPIVELGTGVNTNFTVTVAYGRNADGTPNYDMLDINITGHGGDLTRQVGVSFFLAETGNPIFDYGIATKGPLLTQGSVEVETFNERCWSDVYIESGNSNLALEMTGKSHISGKVFVANDAANVLIGSSSSLVNPEDTGENAIQHIRIGDLDPVPLPVPICSQFEGYVQDTYTVGDPTSNVMLQNIRIPAHSNLTFSNVTINGVMYIEPPNSLSFAGGVTVNGIIVAAGDVNNPSEFNHLDFGGNTTIRDVSALPAGEFGSLTEQTGTCILAPGFSVAFHGNASTVSGVIAASGVQFQGNASGAVDGTVINYSDSRMELTGNTNLTFNRSGAEKIPAGFEPCVTLQFVNASYREPM